MIVTIDGPAGAGKSTAARALARRLGFDYLDTGAMFRAVSLAGMRGGCDFSDEEEVGRLLAGITIDLPPGRVLLNGRDVTQEIRKEEVTRASAAAASSPAVRRFLAELQRTIAAGRDIVCEGRDQGTLVFPDAACKFFLIADSPERARRRYEELAARGEAVTFEQVLEAVNARDERDARRDIAPMKPAEDALQIDSTRLDLAGVVDVLEREVRRCMTGSSSRGTNSST
jgi:cytidylate kinase